MTELLVPRVQVAVLLEWIRTTRPMSGDAGCAHLVFIHPVEVEASRLAAT
jgi:hypothetical protein